MNHVEFIFELNRAGYSKEQCVRIDNILDEASEKIHLCKADLRVAAFQYLVCCTDIDKLKGFLLLSDAMSSEHHIAWEKAYGFVLRVIVGWCH